MKRFYVLFVLLLNIISMYAYSTFRYTYEGSTLTYDIADAADGFKVVGYQKLAQDVVIPDSLPYPNGELKGQYFSVTEIAEDAFKSSNIEVVTMPNTIRVIKNNAFYNCVKLTSIKIPDSVVEIRSGVFRGCSSLTSVRLSNSLINIPLNSFYGCTSLDTITIPQSVKRIDTHAFGDTSLKVINLEGYAPKIYDDSFSDDTFELAIVAYNPECSDSFIVSSSWAKFKSLAGIISSEPSMKYPSNVVVEAFAGQYVSWSPFTYILLDYFKNTYPTIKKQEK